MDEVPRRGSRRRAEAVPCRRRLTELRQRPLGDFSSDLQQQNDTRRPPLHQLTPPDPPQQSVGVYAD